MLLKLEELYNRYRGLEEKLSDPETVQDQKKYMTVNKEYKGLQPIVEAYLEYKNVLGNISSAKEMLGDSDSEMVAMAKEELTGLEAQKEDLDERIKVMMIPSSSKLSKV